jgi:ribonuclease R
MGKKERREKQEKHGAGKPVTGRISVSPAGFGFLTPGGGGPDYFVPPKKLGGAIHGDTVSARFLNEDRTRFPMTGKSPAVEVTEVLSRGRTKIVAELLAGGVARPLCKKLTAEIEVDRDSVSETGAKKGDWVELILSGPKKKSGVIKGGITSVIGRAGMVEADINAVMKEYELPPPYSAEENAEAETVEPQPVKREDLTGLYCVTIDPFDAKDYDDSVSVSPGKKPGELVLGVHISDVAAWISPGSKWDRAARERSFTSYLPGKTLPMLPAALTRKISLTPDKDSFAHSVLITVDAKTGRILRSERCHSVIRVRRRLNFDETRDFMTSGKRPGSWDAELAERIEELSALHKLMRKHRKAEEKFLELSVPDVRVICDSATFEIKGLRRETQGEAEELVEDFMLAGNTEVAKEMLSTHTPGIYRIHPEPLPEKTEDFADFVFKTFGMSPGNLCDRDACNDFLSGLPDDNRKNVITNAFLRALARASYSESSGLHFGLGKMCYCHFTSPIRRYPDLFVHQQLLARDTNGKLRSEKVAAKYAAACTELETRNDEAYYAVNDRLKLQWLSRGLESDPGEVFEAMIARITTAGLQVDIPNVGIYGFVPMDSLGRMYKYKREDRRVKSKTSHSTFKSGDFIYLRLDRIDFTRGTAYFSPAM